MLDSATPNVRSQRLRPMSKRLISTTLLSFALLFAQGGSFLIAAFCPHIRTGVMRCDMPQPEPSMDHGHMGDMEMPQEPQESTDNLNAAALDVPLSTCSHCWVHSQTTSTVFSVQHTDVTQRATDISVAAVCQVPTAPMISAPERPTARSHDPPGNTVSRHILIDVFRI